MKKTEFSVVDGVALITMKSPKTLNALDIQMDEELLAHLQYCEESDEVKVVVIYGEGKAFSAGGDMSYFQHHLGEGNYEALDDLLVYVGKVVLYIKKMKKIVITAVHSHAAGGGMNLALAGDIVIGDNKMVLTEAFNKIGLATDSGAMYLLSKSVGAKKAFEICMSARGVKAEEALALGLVDQIVPEEELMEAVMKRAREIAQGPLLAYELTKEQNFFVNYADMEDYMTNCEKPLVMKTFRSEDFAECVDAFLAKRKPTYKGK